MKLVYFSPVHWQSYAQRPHFMVRRLLKEGVREVLWLDPYCSRLPCWGDLRRGRRLYDQKTVPDGRVRIMRVPALPLEPLPLLGLLNLLLWRSVINKLRAFTSDGKYILGVGRPAKFGLTLLQRLRPEWSFYDAMDDFPRFYSGLSQKAMARHELLIARKVDTVFVSSTYLHDKFKAIGLRPKLISNGCEIEARPPSFPDRESPMVLGYLGTMGSWFDWDLLCSLASQVPEVVIRLIGPVFSSPDCDLPENVEILPPCPHNRVCEHMAAFSAGLIPFKVNALTKGVDPIKYYEYRSLGLPVLTTRFGEMGLRGEEDGVFFLDAKVSFAALVARARGWAEEHSAVEALSFYRQNSWAARFADLIPTYCG